MCDQIRFNDGNDIGSIRLFQQKFNVDAKKYGWDGNENFIDCCMCELDLESFFKDHPEHIFYYENGDWWEGKKSD